MVPNDSLEDLEVAEVPEVVAPVVEDTEEARLAAEARPVVEPRLAAEVALPVVMEAVAVVVVITPEVEAVDQEEITVEVTAIKTEVEAVVKIGITEVITNNNLNSLHSNNIKVVKARVVKVEILINGHNITNKWPNGNKRTNNGNSGNNKAKEALDAKLFHRLCWRR